MFRMKLKFGSEIINSGENKLFLEADIYLKKMEQFK